MNRYALLSIALFGLSSSAFSSVLQCPKLDKGDYMCLAIGDDPFEISFTTKDDDTGRHYMLGGDFGVEIYASDQGVKPTPSSSFIAAKCSLGQIVFDQGDDDDSDVIKISKSLIGKKLKIVEKAEGAKTVSFCADAGDGRAKPRKGDRTLRRLRR